MLRKITNIRVPSGAGSRKIDTKSVFATYDKQSAAFAFYFSDSIIDGAKANLLFLIDGQKVFVDDDVTLGETNETHTFTYPLPDELLNYTGKIDGYLYFDFEDGSHSDEIHFVFTIKKSQIDKTMEEAPDVYIKSFEDVKAEVQEAADVAKETISQKVTEVSDTSDSAISKVNQTAKNANQAQGDIQTSVSDVQSRQAGAKKDIAGLVESTESARDEAVKTMNDIDYSNRNLLKGTSDEWQETTWSDWSASRIGILLQNTKLLVGDTITLSVDIDNTIDKENEANVRSAIIFYDTDENSLKQNYGNLIYPGENSVSVVTAKIPEGTYRISVFRFFKGDGSDTKTARARKSVLNRGAYPADWSLNPAEVATKSELTKIKQAIINLGGEI